MAGPFLEVQRHIEAGPLADRPPPGEQGTLWIVTDDPGGVPYWTREDGTTWRMISGETAASILTKIKTADGEGTGLDADLLDGLDDTAFALADGTRLRGYRSASAPASPEAGQLWLDTNTNPPTLKQYDGAAWQTLVALSANGSVDRAQMATNRSIIVICTSTTRPASPVEGQLIYETDTDKVLKNTGTPAAPVWTDVAGTVGTPEAWIAPTLLNGWVSSTAYDDPAGYYKDQIGVVRLRGLVQSGTAGTMFTLPAGYRPGHTKGFLVPAETGGTSAARMTIDPNGVVVRANGINNNVSLAGISFRAEG